MKASPFCVSVLLSELEKRTKYFFYIFDLASFRCKSRNPSRLIMETVTDSEVLVIVWKAAIREHAHCTSNSPICLPSIMYDIITALTISALNGLGVALISAHNAQLSFNDLIQTLEKSHFVFLLQGATVSFRLYFSRN